MTTEDRVLVRALSPVLGMVPGDTGYVRPDDVENYAGDLEVIEQDPFDQPKKTGKAKGKPRSNETTPVEPADTPVAG